MIKFIISAAVLMSAGSAYGIKTPSDAEINDIQEQIYAAKRMDKQIGDAKQEVRDAEKINASEAHILGLKRTVEREKDKQNAARTKAMHMAILAYGLEPANWSGTSVMPMTKGRTIKWLPRVRESEDHEVRAGGEALGTIKKDRTGYVGITYMDGVTIMDASAFEKGPGFLASYILHERIHFEQFTTDGKGNKMSYAEAQEAAYQAQVDNAEYFFDPKVPAQLRMMQDIEIARDSEKTKAALERTENATILGRLRGVLPRSRPPDTFDAKIHTNAELADISGLVAQARSQADIARQDREEREERARAAAVRSARRDHDERLRNTLAEMATRSCASPGILTQSELDALPDPYNKSFVDAPPGGLDSCAFMLYLRLGRGADADEIRQHSIPLRPIDVNSPPSLIPVRPAPPSAAISPNPRTPFSAVLPGLKVLAETACSSPGRASVDENLIRPGMPFSFAGERDDHAAANLSIGLGDCPRQLFNKLIEMIRSGKEAEITNVWIRDMAAVYSRPAFSRPAYVAPPRNGGDPCRDNGNRRCP